jgi:hypothetical protein
MGTDSSATKKRRQYGRERTAYKSTTSAQELYYLSRYLGLPRIDGAQESDTISSELGKSP